MSDHVARSIAHWTGKVNMTSRILPLLALFLLVVSPALAQTGDECSICFGVTGTEAGSDLVVPRVVRGDETSLEDLQAGLSRLSTAQLAELHLRIDMPIDADESIDTIESRIERLTAWLAGIGRISSIGVAWDEDANAFHAYLVKRLSVRLQGAGLVESITLAPKSVAALERLNELGSGAYVDAIWAPTADLERFVSWIAENDPIKKVFTVVESDDPNPLYSLATEIGRGAHRVFFDGASPSHALAIRQWNRDVTGDLSWDSSPDIEILEKDGSPRSAKAHAFVRGEDLRTIVVPSGDTGAITIVSLPGVEHENPQRVDGAGAIAISDNGLSRGRFLVALPPSNDGFFLTFDRPAIDDPSVTRESIEVVTDKTIPVEEIVRRHQAYWSNQEATQPRYIAHNETTLRFPLGTTGDAVEATLAGDHFFDRSGISDWVWENLYINGVKWKYGSVPELPLVQPEKVAQLPLDIHLTNDYRYELVRQTTRRGFDVWEVTFRPPDDAAEELPLYRGRVWIDTGTYARISISMIQLNLEGEVLSNEERIEYIPFDRAAHEILDPATASATLPSTLLWLPAEIDAQQVLSMVGVATAVIRETKFSDYRIDSDDFTERFATAKTSRYRMVRDTDNGLRYLVPDGQGDRIVKDAFDTSRLFVLGGLHHDDGLEYGVVPLGGLDYFNFDLFGRGWQTNVFFAGVITAVNLGDPSAFGTRANLGVDFFGLALPFENSSYRNGEEIVGEAVDTQPVKLALRGGYPVGEFGKIDLSLGATHVSFSRSDDTAEDFEVPVDTFVLAPVLSLSYERWGYSLSTFYEWGTRTDWEPWGLASEYSDEQKDWTKWGLAFGKTFQLPKFQRVGVGVSWVDGEDLDRFSKYELGFFGSQRVRGIRSGSVRAEAALFGHLSYGFVISDFLRLESFYDIALVDDLTSGYNQEPFQGIGAGGQLVGPWGTLLRFEVGKSVGNNSQDGVVANVVLLKILE